MLTVKAMRDILIITPEGGLLFEAGGIADILDHANGQMADDAPSRYKVSVATWTSWTRRRPATPS